MSKRILTFILCLCVVLNAGTTGKISGKITDAQTGKPLVGVNVIVLNTYLGAATDKNGNFTIINVPPGVYSVKATMIGYTPKVVTDVRVKIDLTTKVDISMERTVLEAKEVVEVVATRPAVQKDLTSSEFRVSANQIQSMPVSEMYELLQIQGGVTLDAGGGIHIRGGRASEVAYWVDGVPVTDVYDNSQAVVVENSAIQELQVISGTFNAEYGNAMSGIVNIVTKEGYSHYTGSISAYMGDHISKSQNLFPGIEEVRPQDERDIQANLGGPLPIIKKFGNFFANIRYNYTDGWLYGKSYFNIYGDTLDNVEYVPMNWRKKLTSNFKLVLTPFHNLKLRVNYLYSREKWEDFDHGLQYVPSGNIEKNNSANNITFSITHTLSSKTFYDLKLSSSYRHFWMWLFEDPNDPRYIDPYYWEHQRRVNPDFWFTDHAINTYRFWRKTNSRVVKFDMTSQVTNVHLVKFGIEGKLHRLELDGYSIIDDPTVRDTVFTPYIPSKEETYRTYYLERPREFSAYIQDKIEFRSVILNIGVRYDYFDANSKIPADPTEPNIYNPRNPDLDSMSLEEREKIWWKNTKPKSQISPRFGISYPITDKGVIHFSFGHFFQIPQFELLYVNPGYKIPETSGTFGIYRNPDLNPQKTVMYEIGLRQEVFRGITVDITGYYRDVRDWVSTGVPIEMGGGTSYVIYANKDYSNVRGIVLSVDKSYSDYWWFNLNYTYQVAEGSNSDPWDEFNAIQANREPRRYIVPLNWDQTHTLNGTIFFGTDRQGVSLIGRFGSGYPYTPTITVASRMGKNVSTQLETNSRRKPMTYEFDLKLFRKFSLNKVNITFFVNIYNLFDTKNELNVWSNTGRANKNLDEPTEWEKENLYASPYRINTIHQYFIHQEWYSEPRKVHIGVNLNF